MDIYLKTTILDVNTFLPMEYESKNVSQVKDRRKKTNTPRIHTSNLSLIEYGIIVEILATLLYHGTKPI